MPELTLTEFEGVTRVAETLVPECDVCGHRDARPTASGYDYELRTCSNRWTYVTCEQCSHVWLHPRPAIEALDTIYPDTYYAYNYEERISPIAVKAKAVIDRAKLGKIVAATGATPTRYLDVGCGDGRYLDAMAKRGVEPSALFGLELDPTIVDRVQQRGYQVFCERIEDCDRFEPGSFDLITMFHVIEHVASPRAVVEKLASLLAPGGVLALETPNIDSLDARLFDGGFWGGYHIPRHWHLFRPSTLTQLLSSAGLEVESTRYETGHAFWMYSFHHRLRYGRRPHPRLARIFDPLDSLLPLVAFTGFDRVRSMVGARTSAMLALARRPD